MKSKFLITILFVSLFVSCMEYEDETNNTQDIGKQYAAIVPTLYTADEIAAANTAADVGYLTKEEKKVIMFTNLARLDGKRFCDDFAEKYIKLKGLKSTNSYVTSFYEDMTKVEGLRMLKPSEALCEAATYHAEDIGEHGITGHNSSDGTSFGDRVKRFLPTANYWAENISYGTYNDIAVVIVMQLLIDDGVSSLGHRHNILNEDITHIGVSIRPHQFQYKYNCVQDFARI